MIDLRGWIAAQRGRRRRALALAAGAVLALAQPPVSWPLVLFAALPVLLALVETAPSPGAAARSGWWAGAGHFAASLFWIVEPFLVDVARHGWMAPLALVLMAGGLALFWAVPFGLARLLRAPGGDALLALATLWTLSEFARAHVLTGFPWGLVAYAWIETPVIQAAALIGPHGLGFLTLVAAMLPLGLRPARLAGAIALVGAGFAWGAVQFAQPAPAAAARPVIRIVQPNAAQAAKWDPVQQAVFYRRLLEATRAPAAAAPAATIWPETAVPFVLGHPGDLLAEVAAAAGPQGRVILGIRRLDVIDGREHWFNSLAVLGPDGAPRAVYDKHRLVPFGEYIPLGGVLARLGVPALATLTETGFRPGPGPRLVSVPGLPPFLPLICYEAIFPHGLDAPGGRPAWLVQVTNDAWFGTLVGPHQHLAQARARAIEQGLPLARSANTGVSALIDPRGRLLGSIGLGESGFIDLQLPAPLPAPPYARSGDLPSIVFVVLLLGLTLGNFSIGLFRSARG